MKYVDIVLVKSQVDCGKLKTKLDGLGNIFIEDTQAGEAVKIGQLPSAYSFHPRGQWKPAFVYTSHKIDQPLRGEERWACSECGWDTDEKHDWCVCGADMRSARIRNKELEELLEQL